MCLRCNPLLREETRFCSSLETRLELCHNPMPPTQNCGVTLIINHFTLRSWVMKLRLAWVIINHLLHVAETSLRYLHRLICLPRYVSKLRSEAFTFFVAKKRTSPLVGQLVFLSIGLSVILCLNILFITVTCHVSLFFVFYFSFCITLLTSSFPTCLGPIWLKNTSMTFLY